MQRLETMLKNGMQRMVSSQFVTSNLVDNFQNHAFEKPFCFQVVLEISKNKKLSTKSWPMLQQTCFFNIAVKLAHLVGPAVFWQMFCHVTKGSQV
jgi:hypothetical protein